MVSQLAGSVKPEPFAVEHVGGSVADFHRADPLDVPRPRVLVGGVRDTAIVLGSSQRPELVDIDACRAAGVAIVRRRSGGGLVLVEPDGMVWFDVVVAADDPRFAAVAADVGASMRWLGDHVAAALAELGIAGTVVHAAGMTGGPLGTLLCFAGIGPGEVLVDGHKLVGISQRRTRRGSRFQCMLHLRWAPERLVGLLAEPRPDVGELPRVAVVSPEVGHAVPGAVAKVLSGG